MYWIVDCGKKTEPNITAQTPHTNYQARWWRADDLGLDVRCEVMCLAEAWLKLSPAAGH